MQITSVHANGSVTLWSCSEREVICKLKLPQAFVVHQEVCTFSGDGSLAFIAGISLIPKCGLGYQVALPPTMLLPIYTCL